MAVPLKFRGRVSGVIQLVSTGQGGMYSGRRSRILCNSIADEFRELSDEDHTSLTI